MDATTIAAMLIIALSGIVFGMTGFGFALVSVPPLLLLYPPETVVTLTLCVGLIISGLVVRDAWQEFQPRVVLSLVPGALVGVLVGIQILKVVDANWLKAGAGLIVTGYALLVLRGIEPRGMQSKWAPTAAGFASGALATSVGLSGPPIVMLFSARRLPIGAFRSSISVYFIVLSIVALVLLAAGSAIESDDLITAVVVAPAGLVGTLIGSRIARRLNPTSFRTLTLILLLVTGIVAIATVVTAFV